MSRINVEFNESAAEAIIEAIEVVLNNCDIHRDEAILLEHVSAKLDFALQKQEDHASDVEPLY